MGARWLAKVKKSQVVPKDSVTVGVVHLSPLGSQLSFGNTTRIENVADWESIAKKYRALMGDVDENKTRDTAAVSTESIVISNDSEMILPNNVNALNPSM